jgi:rhomboid protease GluP
VSLDQRPEDRTEVPITITSSMLTAAPRRGPMDFEQGMRAAPPLILVLLAANVAMFAWEVAAGALWDEETIIAAGALARDRVLAGEAWRLVSAMFLHGGWDHLIGNCIVLYIVGMAVEHAVGLARTAVVYFVSGVAGSLLSLLMSPGPSVGASGAIFGLVGSVIVFLYRHQDKFHLRDKRVGFVLAIWAGYQVLTGFLTPYVDNMAHIGGFLGGAVVTLGLRPRDRIGRPAVAR